MLNWRYRALVDGVSLFHLQSQQFEDPEVERSYLKNIAEQGMVKDTRALLILDVALVIQTQVSRTSQCDEIGEQPCPVSAHPHSRSTKYPSPRILERCSALDTGHSFQYQVVDDDMYI